MEKSNASAKQQRAAAGRPSRSGRPRSRSLTDERHERDTLEDYDDEEEDGDGDDDDDGDLGEEYEGQEDDEDDEEKEDDDDDDDDHGAAGLQTTGPLDSDDSSDMGNTALTSATSERESSSKRRQIDPMEERMRDPSLLSNMIIPEELTDDIKDLVHTFAVRENRRFVEPLVHHSAAVAMAVLMQEVVRELFLPQDGELQAAANDNAVLAGISEDPKRSPAQDRVEEQANNLVQADGAEEREPEVDEGE